MATSGSYNFTMTASDIIHAAFRKIGILAEGEELSTQQSTDALEDLNLLIKSWPARGIDLWRYEDLTVFLNTTSQSYSIGATGDKASFAAYKTELAAAGAASDSTITVDSDDNISNGDVIGIELDDGTIQWTTVNGAPASDVVTLTASLTGAAALDNHVYNYTSIAQRPLRLYDGRLVLADGNEIQLFPLSREEYMGLTTKSTSGKPTQYYYDPKLDNGKLYIWPVSESVQYYMKFSAQRQLQDIDSLTDNLDFPQEWLRAIVFNLAADIAFDYAVIDTNSAQYQTIERKAKELLEEVDDFDVENATIKFEPSSSRLG